MLKICLFSATLSILLIANGARAQGAAYVERQLLCALDQAPCDAWGRQIKGIPLLPYLEHVQKAALPEIIGRNCVNCDRSQLNNVGRVARFVRTRYPQLWAAIVEKYTQDQEDDYQGVQN